MKYSVKTTKTFDKLFKNLPAPIQRKADRKTELFKNNPFHPSLHVEKLKPKHYQVWSFRVDDNYRIIFIYLDSTAVEFWYIGPHHSIYNVNWLHSK